ncbi:RDD family protein [uncultured Campylobacter sp.]|uniref:RDD family protein n=1 Tax=uncultured Campylobacter sp. TaxID=218934 RepID=UPI00260B08D8|nr:RDD family protein [uncultured Campylobacter sp.]
MSEIEQRLEREGLKLASFGKRIAAYVIDTVIINLLLVFTFSDELMNVSYEGAVDLAQDVLLSIVIITFLYHFIFTFLYGASLGKFFCKIAIIDEALLDKPNIMQSALRSAVKLVSENAFMLGYFWAFGNDSRKTWQDYVAKTVVIELA